MSTKLEKFERIWGSEMPRIRDWQHWRELWAAHPLLDFRLSLIHYGFRYPATSGMTGAPSSAEGSRDRMNFYLDLADGWQDSLSRFDESEHHWIDTCVGKFDSPGALRRHIARAAFQALCFEVFKDRRKEQSYSGRPPTWLETVNDPVILQKLIWFFRIEPMGEMWLGRLVNLPYEDRDEDTRIAREFAFQLCRMAWTTSGGQVDVDRLADLEHFQTIKAEFIPILFGLSKLGILLSKDFGGEGATNVDFRSLMALRRLATGFEYQLPPLDGASYSKVFRRPISVDEACYAGNQAARVLVQLKPIRRTHQRLQKIRELAREQQELERRAAALAARRTTRVG